MKEAVQSGELSISKLYGMDSAQRQEMFNKYSGNVMGKEINAGFEKAMVSNQKDALVKWVKDVFSPKEKESANYSKVKERIDQLKEADAINGADGSFLEDLVADKMGISLTEEEVSKIYEKAEKLGELYNQETKDGLPPDEYWPARHDMEKYIQSLNPAPKLRVLTSTAGRGAMLASVKSPLVNIESNMVNAMLQAVERRVSTGQKSGANPEFAKEYRNRVINIYKKSGYDISRMQRISDQERRLGEDIVHSEGPGKIRRLGRFYEDVVFKNMLGLPDVVASSIAFSDSANLRSTMIAEQEGLTGEQVKNRALEIFKDSTAIYPETIEGEIVRSHAIADAELATYTFSGGYSSLALGIRTALNKATGNARLGDQLMPFVKTPANVVELAIDSAGVGFIKAFAKLPEARRQLAVGNGQPMREVIRSATRAGLGMTLALVLSYMFDPDDFIGDYDSLDQKGRDLARIQNAPYNSIKILGKWVSLDYFGPIAAPFVGMMYARKYGTGNIPNILNQYVRGVGGQAMRLPGLREFADLVSGVASSFQKGDVTKTISGLTDETVDYIRARTIPAIVNDLAKAIDPFIRKTGGETISKAQATIPGATFGLPEVVSKETGEKVQSEGFISTLLFGSRIKTPIESAVINEISRLNKTGNAPTISDIEKTSSRVKELKEQIGEDKFQEALIWYGTEYGKKATRMVDGGNYKKSTDEDKKKKLNSIREDVVDSMLIKFKYKKPKK